tara:strand:+ start:132 stop:299 length:168 start_codon:yes stop_codon:yes gene_type:complete
MFKVSEEDRKIFLEYLSKRPYIEVAALIARVAAWTKIETKEKIETKDKNGKDKPQ